MQTAGSIQTDNGCAQTDDASAETSGIAPITASTPTTSHTQKIEYHDAIGHVISWDGATLHLMRDAAANGSRPEQEMFIDARTIVRLKPIPERKHRS